MRIVEHTDLEADLLAVIALVPGHEELGLVPVQLGQIVHHALAERAVLLTADAGEEVQFRTL